jgi:hypothetical protein
VVRVTLLYVLVLLAVYLGFVLYDQGAPGGTSPGTQTALVEFGGVALVVGLAGALLTLSPAPRAVGVAADRIVVVGRWGRKAEWTPLSQVTIRVVRRYPAGLLSHQGVDSVEVIAARRRVRSYLIETGLLPEISPALGAG